MLDISGKTLGSVLGKLNSIMLFLITLEGFRPGSETEARHK